MLSEKSLKRDSKRLKKCKVDVWLASKETIAKVVKWVKSGEMGPMAAGSKCFDRDEEGTSRGLKRPRGRLASTALHRRTNHLRHHLPLAFLSWTISTTDIQHHCDLIGHPSATSSAIVRSQSFRPCLSLFHSDYISLYYSVMIIFVVCSPSSKDSPPQSHARQLQAEFNNTLATRAVTT